MREANGFICFIKRKHERSEVSMHDRREDLVPEQSEDQLSRDWNEEDRVVDFVYQLERRRLECVRRYGVRCFVARVSGRGIGALRKNTRVLVYGS